MENIISIEEFRNLAQGIQAVFIAIAAIIASFWAVYTFRSLLSVKKAKAELEKIKIEIEKNEAELELIKRQQDNAPMLDVIVEPSIIGTIEDNDLGIKIKLCLKNTGNTTEYIDWKISNVKAAKFNEIVNNKILHSDHVLGVLARVDNNALGILLLPDEKSSDDLIIPIEEHGIYVIKSNIYVSIKSTESMGTKMDNPKNICYGPSIFYDTRN